VEKVFTALDKEGAGSVTVGEIIKVFDVSQNPAFIDRRKTRD
jgi:hypothetical protein